MILDNFLENVLTKVCDILKITITNRNVNVEFVDLVKSFPTRILRATMYSRSYGTHDFFLDVTRLFS